MKDGFIGCLNGWYHFKLNFMMRNMAVQGLFFIKACVENQFLVNVR